MSYFSDLFKKLVPQKVDPPIKKAIDVLWDMDHSSPDKYVLNTLHFLKATLDRIRCNLAAYNIHKNYTAELDIADEGSKRKGFPVRIGKHTFYLSPQSKTENKIDYTCYTDGESTSFSDSSTRDGLTRFIKQLIEDDLTPSEQKQILSHEQFWQDQKSDLPLTDIKNPAL